MKINFFVFLGILYLNILIRHFLFLYYNLYLLNYHSRINILFLNLVLVLEELRMSRICLYKMNKFFDLNDSEVLMNLFYLLILLYLLLLKDLVQFQNQLIHHLNLLFYLIKKEFLLH